MPPHPKADFLETYEFDPEGPSGECPACGDDFPELNDTGLCDGCTEAIEGPDEGSLS